MKILHVLSQFEVTGAEAYAASLIEEQVQSGHSAIVVSDTFTLPVRALYIPLPIGKRSYRQRLKNISSLVRLIREHSIDVVHAHSRAASWVSLMATRRTRIPFVSTIHGRQHIHASSKAFSVYGKDIIAVSSALKDHLVHDLGLHPQNIAIIPNCIPLDRWESNARNSAPQTGPKPVTNSLLVFVGRLTGPKGDVVRFLISKVLPILLRKKRVKIQTIGGMITPEDIPLLASSLNMEIGETVVELLGFRQDIVSYILRAGVVIGSGRVVPESMVLRKPVVAFGESNYVGPITSRSFEDATVSNFGDTGIPASSDPNLVAADLLEVLEHPPSESQLEALAQLAKQRFDAQNVARKVHRMYERAFARAHSPDSIPVLMYHRILDQPAASSSHGIWVTAAQFERQLQSLRTRGFQTITFRDYARFLRAEAQLPHRPIVLTFDDGYEDNYTVALPLLQKFGCRAVVFAVTDERRTNFWDAGKPSATLLSTTELRELDRSGMEIGSHTVTHPNLTLIPRDESRRELQNSKEKLEQLLGSEVVSFAYPYGALSASAKELAEEAGYRFAVAADSGSPIFYHDFFEIRRTQVFPWTSRIGFWKKSLPLYHRYKSLKS